MRGAVAVRGGEIRAVSSRSHRILERQEGRPQCLWIQYTEALLVRLPCRSLSLNLYSSVISAPSLAPPSHPRRPRYENVLRFYCTETCCLDPYNYVSYPGNIVGTHIRAQPRSVYNNTVLLEVVTTEGSIIIVRTIVLIDIGGVL